MLTPILCCEDKRRCLSLSVSTDNAHPNSLLWRIEIAHAVCHPLFALATVEALVMEYCITQDQTSWATSSGYWLFLFHFKPWITEVKYSDPSLHLASKGGIQPLYTVGTSASKDIASIHTGKCLQHLLITSWGKAGFSYRFPVGPGTENTSRTVALAEDSRGGTERGLL